MEIESMNFFESEEYTGKNQKKEGDKIRKRIQKHKREFDSVRKQLRQLQQQYDESNAGGAGLSADSLDDTDVDIEARQKATLVQQKR